MNPARIAIILVAGVCALLLGWVVHNMTAKPKSPTAIQQLANQPPTPMTRVLVAKTDLAVGDRLTPDNMTWQAWPATTLNAAYITDGLAAKLQPTGAAGAFNAASTKITDMANSGGPKMQAMAGAIVRDRIYAGEPITALKIVRAGSSGYMAVRLAPGTMAMSLPVTVESGAGGFIQPGDHVDILTSHSDTSKNGGGMVSETVLANVTVLAVDQHTEAPKTGAVSLVGATLTLEVPAGSVETLARAKAQGPLTMVLRSYADIGGGVRGAGPGDTVLVFKGGAPAEAVTAR